MQCDLPDAVTIDAEGRVLTLRQAGVPLRLEADRLRRACRCAPCMKARLTGMPTSGEAGIRLAAAVLVGSYALNLAFSDGHARGVFPFAYLAELAAQGAA